MKNAVTEEMLRALNEELQALAVAKLPKQAATSPSISTNMPLHLTSSRQNVQETGFEIAKLKSALAVLSPDTLRGNGKLYDPGQATASENYWLVVIWAIASLDWTCSQDIAREWSMQSSRYTEDGFDKAWDEYDPNKPNSIGIGSLYRLAQEHGWRTLPTIEIISLTTPSISGISGNGAITFSALGRNNRPQQVTENVQSVMQYHGIQGRYNQISKRSEILVPKLKCVLDESSNTSLTIVTDYAVKAGMTSARIPEMVDALAAQHPYCPVQTYIDSVPWDEISRFDQFISQIKCGNPAFSKMLWRKWLIQAVGAAYEAVGIANAGVIVLTGEQGVGKTRLFSDLTSGISGVFLEGQTLNPADKDSVMSAASHWIVELGELDSTFRKADVAQLKAFITRKQDTLRRPYARKDSVFPRRTVFAGTVNDFQFLHDPTGNRRFWPIDVHSLVRNTTINYQQLWAEVKSWYDAGERWYLSSAELASLNHYSETFLVSDPDVEALLGTYSFFGCTEWTSKTMQAICVEIRIEKPTRVQTMRLAEAIRKYNGGQRPRMSNGLKYHYVPDTSFRGLNPSGKT